MIGSIPEALYLAAAGYAAIGLAVAVLFILFGLERAHPPAHGGLAFRPLLIPGLALLWPYVLLRWRRGPTPPPVVSGQRRQRALHTGIWMLLAFIPPTIMLGGLLIRQTGPSAPPTQLSAPPK